MVFWRKFFKNISMSDRVNNSNSISLSQDVLLMEYLGSKGDVDNIYLSMNKDVNLYELEQLCDAVGWVRRPLRKVKIAIDHSFVIICLFCKNKERKQLIGFARATSDTVFNATIWDVVVHPDFQGRGLGKALMDQLVFHLRGANISTITLFADPQVVSFYRNLGFMTDPDGVKGMFWYPR
nr:GCN5-like N-acetyltransferase [Gloiopeltis furcata]